MVDFAGPLPAANASEESRRAPDPPKRCTKVHEGFQCDRAVSLLFAVVTVGVGQSRMRRVGALSEFTIGVGGELKPHVEFVGWVGRCAECYRDDQEGFCYG